MTDSLYTGNGLWVANVDLRTIQEPPAVIIRDGRVFMRCTDHGDPFETYCEVSAHWVDKVSASGVAETKRALYFGCRDEPGHYLQEGQKTIWDPPPGCPWTLGLMDSGLLKNGRHPDVYDGKVWWTCGGRIDFWYAFFWWDRSVDRRGACNSGFYVLGFKPEVLTPETTKENAALAFSYACEAYPWVIARQHQPLVLQR